MASPLENARRIVSQLAADGSAPSQTARRPFFALNPFRLFRSSPSASRQGGRIANAVELRQLREANLNQLDRASRHVRSTGQIRTTAAPDRDAAAQGESPPPSPSPSPSTSSEAIPSDSTQTISSGGWIIARLWRKARGIDLEAMADNNPIGFLGILIGLANLIVAGVGILWAIAQGIATFVLEARSSSPEEAMRQAKRGVEDAWTNVRRQADKLMKHVGLSLPAPPFHRIHSRQWNQLQQDKRNP